MIELKGRCVLQATPKGGLKKKRQVSYDESFLYDVEKFRDQKDVRSEIETVKQHFINFRDSVLEGEYYDHELKIELKEYRSIHLLPYTDRDVVIVYKIHRNEHVVFYRIGTHDEVYDKGYEKMHAKRRRERAKADR